MVMMHGIRLKSIIQKVTKLTYNGVDYENHWWTQGDKPDGYNSKSMARVETS